MNRKTRRRTAGSVIISILLTVILLLTFTVLAVFYELRSTLSPEGISYMLDRFDPSRVQMSELDPSESGTLLDPLADSINESLGGQAITAADLKVILEKSTLKSTISREAGDIAEDFKAGKSTASFTEAEMSQFLDENWDYIKDLIPKEGIDSIDTMPDEADSGTVDQELVNELQKYIDTHQVDPQYQAALDAYKATGKLPDGARESLKGLITDDIMGGEVKEFLKTDLYEEMGAKLSTQFIRSQMDDSTNMIVDTAFSMTPIYVLIGINAFIILLYLLANHRIIGDAFIGVGTVPIWVCGAMAGGGILSRFMPERWAGIVKEGGYLAANLLGSFLQESFRLNTLAMAVGAGLILFGIIVNAVICRKK